MAKDIIHDSVKNALIKDGWTITHDPYTIEYEDERVYVDLAAERVIAAERAGQKILIEVKSFRGISTIQDFKLAYGQYMLYQDILEALSSPYKLYIALSDIAYQTIQERKILLLSLYRHKIPLLVINLETEEIIKWTN